MSTQPINPNINYLPSAVLRNWLTDDEEIAVIDVREQGVIARDGYLLKSVSLPLSHLEIRAEELLPRKNVRLVIVDETGGEYAHRAGWILSALGYSQLSLLQGGARQWKADGGELFTGTSALSKGFGEYVEAHYGTPHLSAQELNQRINAGENILIVDGRTVKEFQDFSLPGGVACPNAELVYRVPGLLTSADTPVVVNCAGRTRSIIGAQTLINAGLKNPVWALENGTMDWLAAGYELQHDVDNVAPVPPGSSPALDEALKLSASLVAKYQLQEIDQQKLARYQRESHSRALYLLDVRTRDEFVAGHLPGARWAAGGELVQGVDRFVGIQNARVVLVDDHHGIRAATAASWLSQLQWAEVFYLRVSAEEATETGFAAHPDDFDGIKSIQPAELQSLPSATVIDLADSPLYEQGHLPGAWFAVRARLNGGINALPATGPIVLTSPDGHLASYAARDLAAVTRREIFVLDGGTDEWVRQGLALETGATLLWSATDDVWRSAYHQQGDERLAAFQAYLSWEIGLVEQIERDGGVNFALGPVGTPEGDWLK